MATEKLPRKYWDSVAAKSGGLFPTGKAAGAAYNHAMKKLRPKLRALAKECGMDLSDPVERHAFADALYHALKDRCDKETDHLPQPKPQPKDTEATDVYDVT